MKPDPEASVSRGQPKIAALGTVLLDIDGYSTLVAYKYSVFLCRMSMFTPVSWFFTDLFKQRFVREVGLVNWINIKGREMFWYLDSTAAHIRREA